MQDPIVLFSERYSSDKQTKSNHGMVFSQYLCTVSSVPLTQDLDILEEAKATFLVIIQTPKSNRARHLKSINNSKIIKILKK
jgi:hypothetical protein